MKTFVLIIMLFVSQWVQAGAILTALNGLYLSKTTQNADNSSTESAQTYLGFNFSYLTTSRMLFGALYIDDSVDTGSNIEKLKAYGPNFGFLIDSWALEVSYLVQAEYKPNSSSQEKWTGGGYQVALSYLGLANQGLFWGFQWVYRSLDYTKHFIGNTESEAKRTTIETFPQVKIGYAF